MKTAISKVMVVALVVASFALLYSASSSAWTEYVIDPDNPNLINEFTVTADNSIVGETTLDYKYADKTYWRQVATKYEVSNPNAPLLCSVTFDNDSTAHLSAAPPVSIPGVVDGTLTDASIQQQINSAISNMKGLVANGGVKYPTVVNGGGSTDASGGGGVTVTGNGYGLK